MLTITTTANMQTDRFDVHFFPFFLHYLYTSTRIWIHITHLYCHKCVHKTVLPVIDGLHCLIDIAFNFPETLKIYEYSLDNILWSGIFNKDFYSHLITIVHLHNFYLC